MRIILILLALCLFSNNAMAGENIDESAQAVILTQFPKSTVQSWVQGPLDDINNTYIVALINNDDLNDLPLRLIVLLKEPDGYKIVVKSKSWMRHQRLGWNIKIRNKSVFLSVNGSGGCCSHSESTYQFKKYGEKFLLIGVEEITVEVTNDATGQLHYYEYGASTNHLTHKVIHWRSSGDEITMWNEKWKGVWDMPWKLTKTKRHVERTLDFISDRQWNISNFSYYDYSDWVLTTNNLCGYIDMDFQYYRFCSEGK